MPCASPRRSCARKSCIVCTDCNDYRLFHFNYGSRGIYNRWYPLPGYGKAVRSKAAWGEVALMEIGDFIDEIGVGFHGVRVLDG